uniref:Mediator complex subunit 28 n=1 Tax=Myotis myotis TaxID=51298 RepID=A0A7J8ANQ8_MYOMY|nr:mediator complex subunit 28 [Myotis myotis]
MFFSTKKIAVICPEARAGYQRGCLGTAERAAAERRPGPEAPDQAAALAAGAGGHQRAAQEARRHPAGLPGLPRAGVGQHPRASEAELRKSRRKGRFSAAWHFGRTPPESGAVSAARSRLKRSRFSNEKKIGFHQVSYLPAPGVL